MTTYKVECSAQAVALNTKRELPKLSMSYNGSFRLYSGAVEYALHYKAIKGSDAEQNDLISWNKLESKLSAFSVE